MSVHPRTPAAPTIREAHLSWFQRTSAVLPDCPALRALVLALALGASAQAAWAGPIPFPKQPVQMTAREQALSAFLQDFFGSLDIPVVVSPKLNGVVSGNFAGDPTEVFRKLSRAYGVVSHYDGTVLHIYPAGEVTTRTLPLQPEVSRGVVNTALGLRLTDAQNTIRRTADGSLLLVGTPRFVDQIEDLSRAKANHQATRPAEIGVKVFPLRYAWAQDVTVGFGGRMVTVPGVATTLRAMMASSGRSELQTNSGVQSLPPTVPGMRGALATPQQGPALRSGNTLGAPNANAQLDSAGAVATAWGGAGAQPQPAYAPQAQFVPSQTSVAEGGLARIEADTHLNAVIVRDAPVRMEQYKALIEALDVEPVTLEIEATIIDLNTDKLRRMGINWRETHGRGSLLFGEGSDLDAAAQIRDSRLNGAVSPINITPFGQGGYLSAVLGNANQFVARISALQQQGAAKIVSSPQIVTLSNVEAVFDNSKTFYVRVAGRDQVDLFNVSAGTTLRVTPHVFRDQNRQRIKILVGIDDGTITQQQVDAIPIVERSSIQTQALIYEGESLLLGGLAREQTSEGVTKVPFLGDIPLLGNLFKYNNDSSGRTERMFLISPRLAVARTGLPAVATSLDAYAPPAGAVSYAPRSLPVLPAASAPAPVARPASAAE